MVGMKVCPNCGAKNPSSNRFCEDCGYDMNKAPVSTPVTSTPTVPLYCPNGHTVGDTSLGFCDVCGEKLTSEIPSPKVTAAPDTGSPASDITPSSELHIEKTCGKKCPSCGAVNPDDGLFCEECGAALSAGPVEPVHKLVDEPMERKPVIHESPAKREIPDIPSIMRTLTNDDMKK